MATNNKTPFQALKDQLNEHGITDENTFIEEFNDGIIIADPAFMKALGKQ